MSLTVASKSTDLTDWEELNKEDFNTMRSFIDSIEENTKSLPPIKRRQFYQPILYMLVEAHRDTINPEIMKQVSIHGMKQNEQ